MRQATPPLRLPSYRSCHSTHRFGRGARIIRRHINELMYCYQIGLAKEAGLSGRVSVQITIAATGEVVASAVQS